MQLNLHFKVFSHTVFILLVCKQITGAINIMKLKEEITLNNGGIKLESSTLNELHGFITIHVMVYYSLGNSLGIDSFANVSVW